MTKIIKEVTELGFRDITDNLEHGPFNIRKYDVIRRILIDHEAEQTDPKNSKIYYFLKKEYGMRGRVFPNDEVLSLQTEQDLIVQTIKKENNFPQLNIDAQPYHDFFDGEEFIVRISRISDRGDPCFLLYNRIRGFVKNYTDSKLFNTIRTNSVVLVKVKKVLKNEGIINPIVKPLEIISLGE